ncbi:UDP-glucuronosyltransferase [Drosophila subobscura]|uniref:UDP-glucuronosyltransferase n=1 Tax=Drosophila subobscura TaxID=7241 RepID=UPI00155B1B6C|nr:UDP-glucuronosyltransferase [Drosophila subobscura]XP_034655140.1 UDP-glucuronosyltransferase [Drosophila subobscura]
MRLLQLLLPLSLLCGAISCANILAVLPSVWKSHYLFGRRLLQELVASPRNHSVTLISPHAVEAGGMDGDVELPNIREIRIEGLKENWVGMGMSFEPEQMRAQSVMERFTRLIYAGTTNVDLLLSDQQVRKLMTSGEKFDLLIVDLFLSDALLGLAYYYGIPTVAISPTGANSWLNNMFGNPQSSSLDPSNFLPFTERMSTQQRIVNSLMSTFERLTYNFFHLISQQTVYSKHFELLVQELPQYRDLTKNLSLALINSHPGLSYPRAYLPNMLEVGGLHLTQHKEQLQLPNHLLSFMEAAAGGVIYMSLGADVQTAKLPSEKLALFMDVFGHLKEFHFVLKWENEDFVSNLELPENVMIANWWPQQAILSHSPVKLFISSCGQLSVWESIMGDTPILAIPILAEQEVMAKRLQLHGVSLTVNYDAIAYDSLLHGIRQLTLNTSYTESLVQLKKRLMGGGSPSALAVGQIELILDSGGADFLKSHANTLNYWRLEGLDVLVIITIGFVGILTVPFLVISCILRKSYYSETCQQPTHRSTLKVVGRVHSYGEPGTFSTATSTEPLRRTRSAQSLSARSSSSSFSSEATASTTPLDMTPPPPVAQLLGHVPSPLQLYVNQQQHQQQRPQRQIYSNKASQEENTERRFS